MNDNNPFLDLADRQISAPVKSRQRAAATRAKNAAEKKLEENEELSRQYRRYRREMIDAMLDGPFGWDVRNVRGFLKKMGPGDAEMLVTFIQLQSPWIKSMPIDHQYVLLKLIGNGIARVRERSGLCPYDDGVPGEPPKAFEQIKQILGLG
jgi:hypothetical protein